MEWRKLRPEFYLFFLALIPFLRALHCDFLSFDDGIHIYENPLFTSPSIEKLGLLFVQPLNGLYIPLTYLYWGILSLLSQKIVGVAFSPELFHGGNLIIHAFNSVLVFQLIQYFSKSTPASVLAALFFAWHPLHTEPVLWISGSKDLLSSLFLLSALNIYLGVYGRIRSSWVGFLFFCALLSKPSSIILPALLLVFDIGIFSQKLKVSLTKFWPLWLLGLLIVWINKQAQPSGVLSFHGSVVERSVLLFDSIGFYLSKTFFPAGFSLNYGRTPERILQNSLGAKSSFLILLVASGFWLKRKKYYPFIILGSFVVTLLPTSGWIPFYYQRFSNVADRFAYLSLFPLALGLALLINRKPRSKWVYGLMSFIACGYATISYRQSNHWRADHTLLERIVEINPNAENHYNLANALTELKEGRTQSPQNTLRAKTSLSQIDKDLLLKRIEMHFMASINLDPGYTRAYNNLGILRAVSGDIMTAEYYYQKAIDTNPQLVQAYNNLGVSQASRMQYPKAMQNFKKAIELAPDFSDAHFNLGLTLDALGRKIEANLEYQKANELSPNRSQFKSKWKLADKR